MDLATFKARFPEVAPIGDALITAVLAEAAIEIDTEVFGVDYNTAHGFLTAHKIAISPHGRTVKLNTKARSYQEEFENIRNKVTALIRVF